MSTGSSSSISGSGQALIALAIAVISCVIGAVVGPVVTAMLSAKPRLHYRVFPANVVSIAGVSTAIYSVRVSNDGGTLAENVAVVISITGAKLSNVSVSPPPGITSSETVTGSTALVFIPELNSGEAFNVGLEAQSEGSLPGHADVSARAKNANGTELAPGSEGGLADDILFVVSLIAIIFCIVALVYVAQTKRYFAKNERLISDSRKDFQHQIDSIKSQHLLSPRYVLSSACRFVGAPELAEEYLTRPGEIMYWAEADRLADWVISKRGTESAYDALDKYVAIFEFVTDYDKIPSETVAVFLLDTLRIVTICGLSEKVDAQQILMRAFDRDSIITSLRVKHDPALSSFRAALETMKGPDTLPPSSGE